MRAEPRAGRGLVKRALRYLRHFLVNLANNPLNRCAIQNSFVNQEFRIRDNGSRAASAFRSSTVL